MASWRCSKGEWCWINSLFPVMETILLFFLSLSRHPPMNIMFAMNVQNYLSILDLLKIRFQFQNQSVWAGHKSILERRLLMSSTLYDKKVKKSNLLLCEFCLQERGRSKNFKNTFRLKWHVSNQHLEEIPNWVLSISVNILLRNISLTKILFL